MRGNARHGKGVIGRETSSEFLPEASSRHINSSSKARGIALLIGDLNSVMHTEYSSVPEASPEKHLGKDILKMSFQAYTLTS